MLMKKDIKALRTTTTMKRNYCFETVNLSMSSRNKEKKISRSNMICLIT